MNIFVEGAETMKDLQRILKSFSELRDQYSDIQTAIEAVCIDTKLDQEDVLGALSGAGIYILPGSEEEIEIKRFICSTDKTKTTVKELAKEIGFRFCISDREAERLVHKWLNCSEDIR